MKKELRILYNEPVFTVLLMDCYVPSRESTNMNLTLLTHNTSAQVQLIFNVQSSGFQKVYSDRKHMLNITVEHCPWGFTLNSVGKCECLFRGEDKTADLEHFCNLKTMVPKRRYLYHVRLWMGCLQKI